MSKFTSYKEILITYVSSSFISIYLTIYINLTSYFSIGSNYYSNLSKWLNQVKYLLKSSNLLTAVIRTANKIVYSGVYLFLKQTCLNYETPLYTSLFYDTWNASSTCWKLILKPTFYAWIWTSNIRKYPNVFTEL